VTLLFRTGQRLSSKARCAHTGNCTAILHPDAGRRQGEQWFVPLYLPFPQTFDEMPERDFIALPIATATDVRIRADRKASG